MSGRETRIPGYAYILPIGKEPSRTELPDTDESTEEERPVRERENSESEFSFDLQQTKYLEKLEDNIRVSDEKIAEIRKEGIRELLNTGLVEAHNSQKYDKARRNYTTN